MKELHLNGSIDCRRLAELAHAFLNDELARGDRSVIEGHLETCTACVRSLEAEAAFDQELRRRLAREPVAEGLESRVREALSRASIGAGRPRRRWAYAAGGLLAASALIAALILRPEAEPAIHVERSATIVDLICDRHGMSMDVQRACRQPGHINALKVGSGEYWGVVVTDDASKSLAADPAHRGRRVMVEGTFYPAIRSIAIDSIRDGALATLLLPPPRSGDGARGSS